MKKTSRLSILAALLCLIMLLCAACGSQTPAATQEPAVSATPAAEPAIAAVPAGASVDNPEVLATVNGVPIYRASTERAYNNMVGYYTYYGLDMEDPQNIEFIQAYAFENTLQMEILSQKAKELGLYPSDEQIAQLTDEAIEEWNNIVESSVSEYLTEDSTDEEKLAAQTNVLASLEGMGYTQSTYIDEAIESYIYDRVFAEATKSAAVSDEDIQNYFDTQVAADAESYANDIEMFEYMTTWYGQPSYYQPAGFRGIKQILLEVDNDLLSTWQELTVRMEEQAEEASDESIATETELDGTVTESVTQEQVDAARDTILASVQDKLDDIYNRLKNGEDFDTLIAEYNTDPGMEDEPYATNGYSVHRDSIVYDPAFVQAAFSVENIGDVSQPHVGSYGIYIVRYIRDVPEGPVELTDEIRESISAAMVGEKEYDLFDATLAEWMDAANVELGEEAEAWHLYYINMNEQDTDE